MIQKEGRYYSLSCDFCSNFGDEFEDFYDAINYKKEQGWKSINKDGIWFDKCPACIQEENIYGKN